MVRLIRVDIERRNGERTLVMVVDLFAMTEDWAEKRSKAKIRRRFPGTIGSLETGNVDQIEGGYVKRYHVEVLAPLHLIDTELGFEEIVNFFSRMV